MITSYKETRESYHNFAPNVLLSPFQRRQNLRSQLAHAAGAKGEDQVAFADFGGNQLDSNGKLRGKVNCWPLNAAGQPLRRHARNGVLAGGVDGQHDHGVRVGERATELLQKIKGSGVAVGLEDYVDSDGSTASTDI